MTSNRKSNHGYLLFITMSLFLGAVADDCCEPGDTKVDKNDCTKYYACCTGEFVSKSCPSGEYWNPNKSACETNNGECNCAGQNCTDGDTKPNASDCTKYLFCTNGQYVSASCASGLYWNSNTSKCEQDDGQCKPVTCNNGDTKPDSSDCTKYLLCTNGQYVSASCASGLYWNSNTSKCEQDDGQCKPVTCNNGDTKPDSSDCTKYLLCTNGQYVSASCASGLYWNSNSSKCEQDDGQCKPVTCNNGDTKPDSSDCTKYLFCTNGQYVSASCASGLYWNSNTSKCEQDDGQCKPVTCNNGDTKPDSSDCTKYLLCTNGQYVSASCASGLYWNSNSSKCEQDNGQCNGTCKDGELQVNPTDCAGYLQCVNNILVKRKCANQTYFNTDLMACVIDEQGVCIPKVCDPECCDVPNNWLGSVDKNCSAFIHCLYGIKIQQRCPNNLQFNNLTKECDYPENVMCDDGSPPPSGPTAGPSGTYCESKGSCVGKRDGAMLADSQNACSASYIVCQCECEVNFTCSSGLVYNPAIKSCDWPANVDC